MSEAIHAIIAQANSYRNSDEAKHARYEAAIWSLVAILPYSHVAIRDACQQFLARHPTSDAVIQLNWLRSCIEDCLTNGYQNWATEQFLSILCSEEEQVAQ